MSEFNYIFMLIILLCLLVIGMSIYGTFNKVEHFQENQDETPCATIKPEQKNIGDACFKQLWKEQACSGEIPVYAGKFTELSYSELNDEIKKTNCYTIPEVPISITSTSVTDMPSAITGTAPPTLPKTATITPESSVPSTTPSTTEVTAPKVKPEVVEAPKITAPIEVVKETPKPVVKRLDTASSSQTRFMPKTMLQPSYVPADEVIPVIKTTEQPVEKPAEKGVGSKMLSIFKFNF